MPRYKRWWENRARACARQLLGSVDANGKSQLPVTKIACYESLGFDFTYAAARIPHGFPTRNAHRPFLIMAIGGILGSSAGSAGSYVFLPLLTEYKIDEEGSMAFISVEYGKET